MVPLLKAEKHDVEDKWRDVILKTFLVALSAKCSSCWTLKDPGFGEKNSGCSSLMVCLVLKIVLC